MHRYAQLDNTGRCVSVSLLSTEVINPNMILLGPGDDVQPGDIFDGETRTRPEPPEPEPDRIEQLENESAMLTLELVDTQIRLDQTEAEQAALLLELIDKGVL